ncbi:MAG: potassium-transporting ATPase subunit KdpA, partial [Magnetococcus sp. XQGC-1]
MTANGYLQIILYVLVLLLLAWPLGLYMARIYGDTLPGAVHWFSPVERGMYRLCGIRQEDDMTWTRYAYAVLAFNLLGLLVVYLLQRLQVWLPLNPQAMANVTPDGSFNTAISFASNTNWQDYGGESTLSYLTQMLGLTVQNFVSAATGMAVMAALMRGFTRREAAGIGNFWVDMTRSTLYVLLPLSIVFSLLLVGQGVIQTFSPYQTAQLVQSLAYDAPVNGPDGQPLKDEKGQPVTEKKTTKEQTIALGPTASQVAI